MEGWTDGSITIFPRNFVGEGIKSTDLFKVNRVPVNFLHLFKASSILSGSSFKNLQVHKDIIKTYKFTKT